MPVKENTVSETSSASIPTEAPVENDMDFENEGQEAMASTKAQIESTTRKPMAPPTPTTTTTTTTTTTSTTKVRDCLDMSEFSSINPQAVG